jgi:hypothetical protein
MPIAMGAPSPKNGKAICVFVHGNIIQVSVFVTDD